MGEGKKEPLLDRSTINPYGNLDPADADRIATRFIALVRRQGEYNPEGGKGKKVTPQKKPT